MFNFLKSLFNSLIKSFKAVFTLFYYLYLYVFDILSYIFGSDINVFNDDLDSEFKKYKRLSRVYFCKQFLKIIKHRNFFSLFRLETSYNISYYYSYKNNIIILPRFFYRAKNYNYKPIKNNSQKYTTINTIRLYKNHLLFGFKSLNKLTRRWFLSLVLALSSLYFLSLVRVLPVNTVLFQWFALGFFSYLLISGFVFFVKKYRFTRFTSAVQRFWRRSYILFWLIESCLLVVFLYLTFNATSESPYMLDQIAPFKSHLWSWKLFFPKLFLNTILVISGYLLLLNIKWNIFRKNIPFILFITVLLTYMLWSEFYQIFHISNFYANLFWNYDIDEKVWSLESDLRRTRILNHYIMILYILKFWHIVFIYLFWIFFVLRANELDRTRYPIYSANYQNFIILYIMSWLFMYPWLKFILKKLLTVPYFWFYVNNRDILFRVMIYDIRLIIESFYYNFTELFNNFHYFKNTDFYYWIITDSNTNYLGYRKHTIRNKIVTELINK